jgi:hypothetical protein
VKISSEVWALKRNLGCLVLVLAVGLVTAACTSTRRSEPVKTSPTGPRPSSAAAAANRIQSVAPARSAKVQATVPLGAPVDQYFGFSASAVGAGSIWLLSAEQAEIIRVDLASDRVIARIHVPAPVSLSYGQGSVWVTTRAGQLLRIAPSDGSVIARIHLARGLTNLAVGASRVWVTDRRGRITGVDPASDAVAFSSQVGDPETDDFAIAATEGALWAWGVNSGLSRVDAETGRVQHFQLETGDRDQLAAGFGKIWAASQSTGQVYEVEPTSGRILRTWQLAPEAPPTAPGLGVITTGEGATWAVWTSWQRVKGAKHEVQTVFHIVRIDPKTGRTTSVPPPPFIQGSPPELVAETDGSLWWLGVASRGGKSVLERTPTWE